MRLRSALAAALALLAFPSLASAQSWTDTGPLSSSRIFPAPVAANGTILLVGGSPDLGSAGLASAELYDPAAQAWAVSTIAPAGRLFATASMITVGPRTGWIFVVGGSTYLTPPPGLVLNTTDLYDPTTDQWQPGPPMGTARRWHTATTMPGGNIRVCGGAGANNMALNTCESYDPTTNAWATAPAMLQRRRSHQTVVDGDGTLLIFGGTGGNVGDGFDVAQATVEAIVGATASMRTPMGVARSEFAAHLLGDGRVLVLGGISDSADGQIYTPANDAWVQSTAPSSLEDSSSTLLGNGCVLVVGGTLGGGTPSQGAALFDPDTDAWTSIGSMPVARRAAQIVAYDAKHAVVAGGFGLADAPLSSGAEYALHAGGENCVTDCECMSKLCGDGVCLAEMPANNGDPCAEGWECGSQVCIAGVCCESQCDGACKTCETGTCAPKAVGTPCGATNCESATVTGDVCNEAGDCGSASVSCSPYTCADVSACGTTCKSLVDCTTPFVCDTGKCVTPPSSSSSDGSEGGCGCEAPGSGGADGAAFAVLAAGVALASRRRRR